MTKHELGNGESYVVGIIEERGSFLALTATQSKVFKTRRGAERWMERRGLTPDGKKIDTAGITMRPEGGYHAVTGRDGRVFYDLEAAEKWLGERGFLPNGERVREKGLDQPHWIVIYGEKVPYNCTRKEMEAALDRVV